jgi:hypothetical protein
MCAAVHAHVAVGFVGVAVAHGEHLGKVERIASCLAYLVFEERRAGETPACSAFVLVFYGCDGYANLVCEYEAFHAVCVLLGMDAGRACGCDGRD